MHDAGHVDTYPNSKQIMHGEQLMHWHGNP